MGDTLIRRTVLFLATIAQFGVAIAMIIFVRRLSDVSINTDTQQFEEMSCSLNAGTTDDRDTAGFAEDLEDESLCVLAYAGASITLFAMFVLSILLVRFLRSANAMAIGPHHVYVMYTPACSRQHCMLYRCAFIADRSASIATHI